MIEIVEAGPLFTDRGTGGPRQVWGPSTGDPFTGQGVAHPVAAVIAGAAHDVDLVGAGIPQPFDEVDTNHPGTANGHDRTVRPTTARRVVGKMAVAHHGDHRCRVQT